MKQLFTFFMLALCGITYSQTVTIDYYQWNPQNPPCHIFAGGRNVPATGTTSGTILHNTKNGQPTYNTTDRSVQITTTFQAAGVIYKGGSYQISYNFKKDYSYSIKVTAAAVENTIGSTTGPYLNISADNYSGSISATAPCSGPTQLVEDASGQKLSDNQMAEYVFNFGMPGDNGFLNVSAISAREGGTKTVRIRKIIIQETPPPAQFTLSPSSLPIICGATAGQTFTANNIYSTPGITNYTWNLGSANNGWQYNGTAAPQTISTGTANTLTLVPVCGATPKSVSVTATASGQNYPAINSSIVSVSKPSLSISGSDVICGYSATTYNIVGGTIPCSSPVIWTVSPQSVVQPTSSSLNGQIFLTRTGTGTVILTASTSACGIALTKTIQVGAAGTPVTINKQDQPCQSGQYYQTFYLSANNTTSYSTWNWYVESSTYGTIYNIYSPNSTTTLVNVLGSAVIKLSYKDGCGNTQTTSPVTLTSACNGSYSIIVSPNPSTGDVSVTASEGSASKTITGAKTVVSPKIYRIEIVTKLGNVVKRFSYPKGIKAVNLDLHSLTPDVYLLRTYDKNNMQNQQQFVIAK